MKKFMLLAIMAISTPSQAKEQQGRFLANYYSQFFINGMQQSLLLLDKHSKTKLNCINSLPKNSYSEQYFKVLNDALTADELKQADELYAGKLGTAFIDIRQEFVLHEKKRLSQAKHGNKSFDRYYPDKIKQSIVLAHIQSPLGQKIETATTHPTFNQSLIKQFKQSVKTHCEVDLPTSFSRP